MAIKSQLNRNGVTTFKGKARFVDPYSLEIEGNGRSEILTAGRVLIACGTRAARAPEIPFGKSVLDADQVGQIERIPRIGRMEQATQGPCRMFRLFSSATPKLRPVKRRNRKLAIQRIPSRKMALLKEA